MCKNSILIISLFSLRGTCDIHFSCYLCWKSTSNVVSVIVQFYVCDPIASIHEVRKRRALFKRYTQLSLLEFWIIIRESGCVKLNLYICPKELFSPALHSYKSLVLRRLYQNMYRDLFVLLMFWFTSFWWKLKSTKKSTIFGIIESILSYTESVCPRLVAIPGYRTHLSYDLTIGLIIST